MTLTGLQEWMVRFSALNAAQRAEVIATFTGIDFALSKQERPPAGEKPPQQAVFKELGERAAEGLLDNNAASKEGL